MLRRTVLACTVISMALATPPARAQIPFPRDLVPTRTALARLGLERQWMAVVPLTADERVMLISMAEDLIFVHTNSANFHAYHAETGRLLWTNKLGSQTSRARPASVNSFGVFVTNLDRLYAIDRRTGRTLWTHPLGARPSSPTACDEERLYVGLASGKLYGYTLKVKDEKGIATRISDRPIELWNWQTGGPIESRPLPASRLVAFGSDDGRVYVSMSEERTMLYRVATGGPIAAGLGAMGTRLLLVPSADRNLYGVDLLTAQVLWTFPTGASIDQEPLVADNDVFVVNAAGALSSVDPTSGSPRWTTSTQGGRLLAVGARRIYLESHDADLFVVDRASGQTVADPRATLERIGLNFRPYDLGVTNSQNDRLYFGTTSGMVLCVREIGATKPRTLRDPKALPFGYIPKEGVKLTPPGAPSAGLGPAPAPEAAPAEAKPPAEGEKPPAEGEKPAEPADAPPPAPAPAPGGDAPK